MNLSTLPGIPSLKDIRVLFNSPSIPLYFLDIYKLISSLLRGANLCIWHLDLIVSNIESILLLKIIIKIPVRGSSMVFNKAFCAATVSFSPLWIIITFLSHS